MKPITPRNDDGAPLIAEAMRTGSELILPTHNFCDATTWYTESVRVEDEVLSGDIDGLVWTSDHDNWIDMTHGKLFDENSLCEDVEHGYSVIVTVNGVTKTQRPPFHESGGDYTVNYSTGQVTFSSSQLGNTVRAWYSYANGSMFKIMPDPGKRIDIEKVKVQFSADIGMNDTMVFEVWAYNPNDLPNKVMVEATEYKTLENFIEESFEFESGIPVVGGSLRGITNPLYTFKFAYRTMRSVKSSYGIELRVRLKDNIEYSGTRGTATFFCTVRDDDT